VACVAEAGESWFREVANLVLSIRRFGGALAEAPIVAMFVERVEPQHAEQLTDQGVEVRVVDRFDPRSPASNKLRMLELAGSHRFDALLAIDTDTLVMGDISPWFSTTAVRVKPENHSPYGPEAWQGIYEALGIAPPSRSAVMTSTGELTSPYFNSGVVFVPRDRCAELLEAWTKGVHDVLDLYADRPDLVPEPERHWTNQLALAVALTGARLPVDPLPVGLNLSTTVRVHPMFRHEVVPPFVLHYHNEIDSDGFVFRSRNATLNPFLDAFNRARADVFDLPYDGLPNPPLARRLLRRVEGTAWYDHPAVTKVRTAPVLAPVRRRVVRLARGRP
jgi:hypothetical protein